MFVHDTDDYLSGSEIDSGVFTRSMLNSRNGVFIGKKAQLLISIKTAIDDSETLRSSFDIDRSECDRRGIFPVDDTSPSGNWSFSVRSPPVLYLEGHHDLATISHHTYQPLVYGRYNPTPHGTAISSEFAVSDCDTSHFSLNPTY
jgi:hypothetical protein